jgi:hypothetical protein
MKVTSIKTEACISMQELAQLLKNNNLMKERQTLLNVVVDSEGLKLTFVENPSLENSILPVKIISSFTEDQQKIIDSKSLEDLDLSIRAFNCIKSARIKSLGELLNYSKSDLKGFRNFGQKSIDEIENLLQSLGLQFRSDS